VLLVPELLLLKQKEQVPLQQLVLEQGLVLALEQVQGQVPLQQLVKLPEPEQGSTS
jgi:hypothetical protein